MAELTAAAEESAEIREGLERRLERMVAAPAPVEASSKSSVAPSEAEGESHAELSERIAVLMETGVELSDEVAAANDAARASAAEAAAANAKAVQLVDELAAARTSVERLTADLAAANASAGASTDLKDEQALCDKAVAELAESNERAAAQQAELGSVIESLRQQLADAQIASASNESSWTEQLTQKQAEVSAAHQLVVKLETDLAAATAAATFSAEQHEQVGRDSNLIMERFTIRLTRRIVARMLFFLVLRLPTHCVIEWPS